MPDSRINIIVDLQVAEGQAQLRALRQEIQNVSNTTSEAIRRYGEYAGGIHAARLAEPIKETTAGLRQQATVLEQAGVERALASERMSDVRAFVSEGRHLSDDPIRAFELSRIPLEQSLGPDPDRTISTTRTLPNDQFVRNLSSVAFQDDQGRIAKQQAAIDAVTAAEAKGEEQRTAKARAEAQKRERIAAQEAAIREANAAKGYVSADRDIRRETIARQREAEVVGNATIKAAAERERAAEITYREAIRENRQFEQQRYRATTATPEDQDFGRVPLTDLSRLPNYRQFQAFEGERQAAESRRGAGASDPISRILSRLNRQGTLEGQAAVINTVQALASGMSPMHVAMMEGTQLAGAAVQGNLVSLQQILNALISPIGIAVAGLGTLAGIIGTLAYRSYQTSEAIRTSQGNLAARGFGQETIATPTSLRQERTNLRSQFSASAVTNADANTINTALNTAAPEAQEFRKQLQELVVGYAATNRVSIDEASKVIGGAAEGGVEGVLKLSRTLNINNDAWRENIQNVTAAEDRNKAFGEVVGAIRGRLLPGIEAAQAGPAWFPNLPKYIDAFNRGSFGDFANIAATGIGRIDPTKATPIESEVQRSAATLGTRLAPEEGQRNKIQGEYNKLKEVELGLATQISQIEGGKGNSQLEASLGRVRTAIQNVAAEAEPKGPAEQNRFQVEVAEIDRQIQEAEVEAQARPEARERVISLQRQRLVVVSQFDQNAITRTGDVPSRRTPEQIQNEAQIEQQQRTIQREALETQIFRIQRQAIEQPANPIIQRQAAEQRNLAVQTAPDAAANVQERRSADMQAVQARQQETLAIDNTNIALLQQQSILAEARGDLDEILRIHEKINQVIQSRPDLRSPVERVQSQSQFEQVTVRNQQREVERGMLRSGLERAQNPADLGFQRLSLEQDLNNLIASGLATEEQKLQKLGEIVHARQTEVTQAQNLRLLDLQENDILAQSRGRLDEIVTLRRQAAAIVASNPLSTPEQKRQADIAITQAEVASLERSVQLRKQAIDLQNHATVNRSETQRAALSLSVERGDMPRQAAIQQEMQLNQQVMASQQQRVQAELANGDLNYQQKAELFSKLGDLYEQDAQKQLQLQRELTQAINAENEHRTRHIKEFFKTVEGGMEDALANALSGKKSWADSLKDLRQNAVSSLVKGATGMLSEFAGKGLASSLGVKLKKGEDSSISNVLTKALGSALGLTKEAPKTDVERIRDLTQKATDAQQQAAKELSEAAKDLKAAAGNIGSRKVDTSMPAERPLSESPYVDSSGKVRPDVVQEMAKPGPVQTSIKPSGNAGQDIASTLKARGWSDAAVAGALNNSITESSLNPNATGAAKEFGLFQLHPKSHLQSFLQQYGGDRSSVAQTNYMADVVEKTMPGYKNIQDPKAATREFLHGFEKPADQSDRQVNARFANNQASQAILASSVSDKEEAKPVLTVPERSTSKMIDIQDIGAPVGPKGFDYIFGKNIPRPEVDAQGNITKYSIDPKQAEADKIITRWDAEKEAKVTQSSSIQTNEIVKSQTISDLLNQAAPRYKEVTGGQDLQADFQKAWGHPFQEMSTALRIQKGLGDEQLKPIVSQANSAIQTAHPGLNIEEAFKAGKPSLDELLKLPVAETKITQEVKHDIERSKTTSERSEEAKTQKQEFVQQDTSQQRTAIQQTNSSLTQLQSSASTASSELIQTGQSASTISPVFEVAGSSAVQAGTSLQTTGTESAQAGNQISQAGQQAAQAGQQFAQAGTQAGSSGGSSSSSSASSSSSSGGGFLSGIGDLASLATSVSALTGVKASPLISKLTAGVSLISQISKLFSGGGLLGGLFGGGGSSGASSGGGMFGGLGSIFSAFTSIFGLFALEEGGVIPSAAGGVHVQETALPSSIRTGIVNMAQSGQVSLFKNSRITSNVPGALGIGDGKGGRLGILHSEEMVLPRAETKMILAAMNDNSPSVSIPAAAGGMFVSNFSVPRVSVPSRLSGGFQVIQGGKNPGSDSSFYNNESNPTQHFHEGPTAIHISAIDSRSGMKFIEQHGDAIVREIARKRRNFDGRGR